MGVVDLLKTAADQTFTDEDGKPYQLKMMQGISTEDLTELENKIPGPIPDEVKELLQYSVGIEDGPVHMVDFSGRLMWDFKEVFPFGHPIAQDGWGNYWIVDINQETGEWSPIYYVCHDPLVIIYQSTTLSEFISELMKLMPPGEENLVDKVHEFYADKIWRENPGLIPVPEAVEGNDPVLKRFAEDLDDHIFIVDMRNARVGDGFAWGKGGWSELHRHGIEHIFAFEQKKNIFQRLFSKK